VEGGVVGGVLGGVVGGVLGGVVGEVEAPVRTGGNIKPPKLIKEVPPDYPEIARQARVEGVVIIEATTDIYGRVASWRIMRSIPLLDQAAIDAVKQWVYEPLVVNGRPRGVIFTVTVRFKLK
jgi:protein TonB